jgi:hypothetical protein
MPTVDYNAAAELHRRDATKIGSCRYHLSGARMIFSGTLRECLDRRSQIRDTDRPRFSITQGETTYFHDDIDRLLH